MRRDPGLGLKMVELMNNDERKHHRRERLLYAVQPVLDGATIIALVATVIAWFGWLWLLLIESMQWLFGAPTDPGAPHVSSTADTLFWIGVGLHCAALVGWLWYRYLTYHQQPHERANRWPWE